METRYIREFYDHFDEDGRLASRHGSVEFLTTMHYIHRYLRPGAKVLEIGAGTGRYSHALAREGCRVDAVELVEHNIEIFRQNTLPGEAVTVTRGNALDLTGFESDSYDVVLLLGPLRLDLDAMSLTKNGAPISLTPTEYKILSCLMRAPGRIFTKVQLYEAVSGTYFESDENTMMVHISKLRDKIEDDPRHPCFIKTVRGLGYKIEAVETN